MESYIATNNAKYPIPDYFEAHDSLVCIAEKSTINHENRNKFNDYGTSRGYGNFIMVNLDM